ncbi:SnoaL-like domain-containing protein [Rhizobium sp. NFR07]|uniref:nuclear transport factor 2 family protein n=1 Tax=Rhizobium sp. NFR07 TaxID=1566262 RepID=UPI0008EDA452|nr:nuclear transport factor 2 family protein [Rhizobium sp. NFR07]SFB39887.1 SnoaL-like domain-containing protein [Rhizobium sp. NFR07]
MPDMTKSFIDALGRLETQHDADTIALLFADRAQVANPLVNYDDGGSGAAKTFWSQYRAAFDEIRSEFSSVTEKDGMSFLEWHSRGLIDGKPFDYDGVSVLESDGEKITAFRTYFDTRHIPAAHSKGGAQTGRA